MGFWSTAFIYGWEDGMQPERYALRTWYDSGYEQIPQTKRGDMEPYGLGSHAK